MPSSRLYIALTSLVFLAALAAALVFLLRPADAATITVNNAADVIANDGACTLREAIIAANTDTASGGAGGECPAGSLADIITLPAGTYTLSIAGPDEDGGATGDLDITDDVTVNGAGAGSRIIEACAGVSCTGVDRVFHAQSGTVSISGVTIRNGAAANAAPQLGSGGGIHNAGGGTLTLTDSIVSGNSATGGGGGIRNNGTMTLTNSAVSGNTAIANSLAGGIRNDGNLTLSDSTVIGNQAYTTGGIFNLGTLMLTNSTVSGNMTTNFDGAGISNNPTGTATITNSTISGNTAAGHGGGIRNDGNLTLTNSTVSGNTANLHGGGISSLFDTGTTVISSSTITNNTADFDGGGVGDGGGIFRSAGTVNLKNTILAGNQDLGGAPVEPDCFGELNSQGYNLIQTVSAGCSITGDTATNVTGQAANLGPLANNAPGTTMTHAILAGSPAIDFASAGCPPPIEDQRGDARPQGNRCDIGAYESAFNGPTPVPTPSPTPTPTPTQAPTPSPACPGATAPPGGTCPPCPTAAAFHAAGPVANSTCAPITTPTPTPIGQTPTPTPTATPIGQTPTPTATPTPTPSPFKKGDANCDGAVNSVDALQVLRYVAGMQVNQKPGCPEIGGALAAALVAAAGGVFGDVDCDAAVNSVDALKILRYVAGLLVSQPQVCSPIDE